MQRQQGSGSTEWAGLRLSQSWQALGSLTPPPPTRTDWSSKLGASAIFTMKLREEETMQNSNGLNDSKSDTV